MSESTGGNPQYVDQILDAIATWCKEFGWSDQEIKDFKKNLNDLWRIDPLGSDNIFERIMLPDGVAAEFPLDFYTRGEEGYTAFVLQREGGRPSRLNNLDNIRVSPIKMGNAISLDTSYIKDKRTDIIRRAISLFLHGFRKKSEKDKLNLLYWAAKDSTPEPLSNIKELVTHFAINRRTLTHIVLSRMAFEIIRTESESPTDPLMPKAPKLSEMTDKTIPVLTGINEMYGINVVVSDEVSDQYVRQLQDQWNSRSKWRKFSDWFKILFGFKQKPNLERQVILGLDLSKGGLVHPVTKTLEVFADETLKSSRKRGFYGWTDSGLAVLDGSCVGLAYLPF